MKKSTLLILGVILINSPLFAQNKAPHFSEERIKHNVEVLASDSLQGRKVFTPGIEKAAAYITGQFASIGLQKWHHQDRYLQRFDLLDVAPQSISAVWNGEEKSDRKILAISTQETIDWSDKDAIPIDTLTMDRLRNKMSSYLHPQKNRVVWVKPELKNAFSRLRKYFSHRVGFGLKATTLFVLADEAPEAFHIKIKNKAEKKTTANIVGCIPGKTRPKEVVVFSAHYDHLGTDTSLQDDQIYNGANDDASGTSAVIALARYYKEQNDNARTLVFVTFTGEEEGEYGSQYFSKHIDADRVVAMFNIEMIGTPAKWGENTAYITGYDKSDFGKILQKNLKESAFSFHPDPYPKQHLFYRSDNASLAKVGVPAHTISTAKMDKEPHYHQVGDEISTVDFDNMVQIIRAIAVSANSIVKGEDTPTRVTPQSLQ